MPLASFGTAPTLNCGCAILRELWAGLTLDVREVGGDGMTSSADQSRALNWGTARTRLAPWKRVIRQPWARQIAGARHGLHSFKCGGVECLLRPAAAPRRGSHAPTTALLVSMKLDQQVYEQSTCTIYWCCEKRWQKKGLALWRRPTHQGHQMKAEMRRRGATKLVAERGREKSVRSNAVWLMTAVCVQ